MSAARSGPTGLQADHNYRHYSTKLMRQFSDLHAAQQLVFNQELLASWYGLASSQSRLPGQNEAPGLFWNSDCPCPAAALWSGDHTLHWVRQR